MAEQNHDGTPRRYEETMEPQNPPNSVLSKDARRATVWSYFVPVVALFVVVGLALVYWSNQQPGSQPADADRSEIGTAGRTDGGIDPAPTPDSTRAEIEFRGDDLAPITKLEQLHGIDARQMNGRRVVIEETTVESKSGGLMWVGDGDDKFPVIAPADSPSVNAGTKVSLSGRVAADASGAPQIRAERIQVK